MTDEKDQDFDEWRHFFEIALDGSAGSDLDELEVVAKAGHIADLAVNEVQKRAKAVGR